MFMQQTAQKCTVLRMQWDTNITYTTNESYERLPSFWSILVRVCSDQLEDAKIEREMWQLEINDIQKYYCFSVCKCNNLHFKNFQKKTPQIIQNSAFCKHVLMYFYYILFQNVLRLKYFIWSLNYFAFPHMNDNSSLHQLLAGLTWCNADLAVRAGWPIMQMLMLLAEHQGAHLRRL